MILTMKATKLGGLGLAGGEIEVLAATKNNMLIVGTGRLKEQT